MTGQKKSHRSERHKISSRGNFTLFNFGRGGSVTYQIDKKRCHNLPDGHLLCIIFEFQIELAFRIGPWSHQGAMEPDAAQEGERCRKNGELKVGTLTNAPRTNGSIAIAQFADEVMTCLNAFAVL
jgi:hypothetical protein